MIARLWNGRRVHLLLAGALVLGVALAFVGTALAGWVHETLVDDVMGLSFGEGVSYEVPLQEGDQVVVRAICEATGPAPGIEVWSPSGDLLFSKVGNYLAYHCISDFYSARVAFTAPEAGTYRIIIWGWATVHPYYDNERVHIIVERTFWEEEVTAGFCDLGDERLNPHCGAPVAIYAGGSYDVYAINTASSKGELVLHLSDEAIEEAGVPAAGAIVLGTVSNPFSGYPITVYRLATGELQLNTYYWDGKPYIVRWELGASGVEVVAW